MQCQGSYLLLWHLGRHEPHVRPGDRLADHLGVSGVVLVPLHVGLHVGGRHTGAPCGRAPEVHATDDATRRRLQYRPGMAADFWK